MRRIVTAVIGLPILWAVIKLSSPLVWGLLIAVVSLIASREMLDLLRAGGHRVYRPVGLIAAVAVLVPFAFPRVDAALPVVAACAATIALGARRARSFSEAVDGAASTMFTVALVGLNLGYQIALRSMSEPPPPGDCFPVMPLTLRVTAAPSDRLGQDLLCLLLVVVWAGDSAAYFVGSKLGRTPLAPRVSPRKTVEGALAGVAASAGAAIVASLWFFQRLPIEHAVFIGILLGLAGIVGDLAESVVKRAAKAKDSAALLPGHGGVLDRVDSLLLAAPALYYYHRALLWKVL